MSNLVCNIYDLIHECHEISRTHGWWNNETRIMLINEKTFTKVLNKPAVEATIPEKLCLIHSEVSEALEEYRKKNTNNTWMYWREQVTEGKPEGFLVELADVVIRVFDLVGALGVTEDFVKIILIKMEYNKSRPYRHGGKVV